MIFKRQLYLRHIDNTQYRLATIDGVCRETIHGDHFSNDHREIDDRNSYLCKLYEEFKKEEDLLSEDPENTIFNKGNELENIKSIIGKIEEDDKNLFKLSKEVEDVMAEKLKILSNDQIEEYRRNSNKKNLSDQERENAVSIQMIYRFQGQKEAYSYFGTWINEDERYYFDQAKSLPLFIKIQEKSLWNDLIINHNKIMRYIHINKQNVSEPSMNTIFGKKATLEIDLKNCSSKVLPFKSNPKELTQIDLTDEAIKACSIYKINNHESLRIENCGLNIQKVHKILDNPCYKLQKGKGKLDLDCGEPYKRKITPLFCKSLWIFIECNSLVEFHFTNFKLYASQFNLILNASKFANTVEISDNEMVDKEPIRMPPISSYEYDPNSKSNSALKNK